MKFKSKASEYGYYFGKFCEGFGVLLLLLSLPFICNDTGELPINIYASISGILGFLIYWYGVRRTGGIKDNEEENDEWNY